ncbi:hypothetical protein B0H11DRAFT_194178 [Mycena galericulata]|nr:hypothetical protein B0H11DRAFT_194178 [Mycena galericulata]
MATRQNTPNSSPVVLAPTNSLKRALSEDAESDSLPDPKKIKLKLENTPQAKDKKKRKKKKKKTPVVVPLDLLASTNATPSSNHALVLSPILTATGSSTTNSGGKGKRKAASAPPLQVEGEPGAQEGEGVNEPAKMPDAPESSSETIARLTEELNTQSALVKKHEATLEQLKNQSLTCQVCLDLLHKPYALAPCGHIACYNCLVAWFTSEPEEPHFGGPRKKTCPHCRATIKERPVEVWSIKDMVAALLKSSLLSGLSPGPPPPPALPGLPAPVGHVTPPDPWHNIFRYSHQHPRFHPAPAHREPASVEDMGMLDMEDGGVYRCLDCMHEIWDGVCTACQRVYPGHQHGEGFEEGEMFDDSDDDDGPVFWPPFPHMHPGVDYDGPIQLPFTAHWFHDDDDDEDDDDESDIENALHGREDGYDSFIDDADEGDGVEVHRAAAIIEIDSDSDRASSPPRLIRGRRAAPNRLVTLVSSDDEDENEAPRSRRRRAGNRVASPVESEVIVVSDDDDTPRRISRVSDDDDDEGGDYAAREFSDDESSNTSADHNDDSDGGGRDSYSEDEY